MTWSTRELATLAGTTVNTVRHYHRVGLLDEPQRMSNGYKQYGVAHLVRETINERNTDLFAASGRLLLAISPITNPVGFYIGAGPALLTRGSSVFDEDESRTDFGGTAGLGFRFALGESGRTALRLDIEDYFYNGDFGGEDEFQNDIVASLGLSIGLGGRADSDEP